MSGNHGEHAAGGHGHDEKKTVGQKIGGLLINILWVAIGLYIGGVLLGLIFDGTVGAFNSIGQGLQNLGNEFVRLNMSLTNFKTAGMALIMHIFMGFIFFAFGYVIVKKIIQLIKDDDHGGGGHGGGH